jgi:peroxiredoxin
VREGIAYARNLVESPRDPERGSGAQSLGRFSLLRLYVRYERWDSLLEDDHLDWSDSQEDKSWKAYGRGLAFLGKGDPAKAAEELKSLSDLAAKAAKKPGREADLVETARCELAGRLRVREGRILEGFELLAKGSKLYQEKFKGDLAGYPRPFQESEAQAHLEAQNWGLAEATFRAVLEERRGTLVSLAGLVEACHRRGRKEETMKAYAEFLAASRRADQDLPYAQRFNSFSPALAAASAGSGDSEAAAGGGPAGAEGEDPPLPPGPRLWTPTPAPSFQLEDSAGARVELSSLRGRTVILLFHLGYSCQHCVEQLTAVAKERESFEKLGTSILALGEDTPEAARAFLASPKGQGVSFPLLTDPERKVAKSYGIHDTFEDLAIHGVVLLDREGGIRWSRKSAQPFMDVGFLKSEIERLERLLAKARRIRI